MLRWIGLINLLVLCTVPQPNAHANACPQVAGLDFGWGNPQDMQWDSHSKRHTLQRKLPPGEYPYKFIFEDRWTTSADHPTLQVKSPKQSKPLTCAHGCVICAHFTQMEGSDPDVCAGWRQCEQLR